MIISRDTVELPEKIPEGIKHLRLENNFEKYIDNLPNGLITLTCGRYFNLPLNNLPNTLKLLVVCGIFNQPLDFLPNSLIYLQIGNAFTQSLINLPNSLKYLKLGRKIPLHNNGTPVRTWLHASDTAEAIITIIESGSTNEIYNIAGDFEQSNLLTVS